MYNKIMFPVDPDIKKLKDPSLKTVIEMAQAFNAKLYIISVVQNYGMSMVQEFFPKGWMEQIISKTRVELEKFIDKYLPNDVQVDILVECGPIYQTIIDKAEELSVDLIVMSAHRPELCDYLLGSNAAKVVRHSKTSVLIVR